MSVRITPPLCLMLLAVLFAECGGCKRDSAGTSVSAGPTVVTTDSAQPASRDPLIGSWQVTDVRGAGQLPPELANMADTLKTNTVTLHLDHSFRSFNANAGGYSGTWLASGKKLTLTKGPFEADQYPDTKTLTIDGDNLLDANESYTMVYAMLAANVDPMISTVGDFLAVKDEATFKSKYYDKPIQIAGTIFGINGFNGIVMLRDSADTVSANYAQCYLMDYASYGKLANGQAVTLRGIAVGEAGSAVLEDCQIIEAGTSTGVTLAAGDLAGEIAKDTEAAMQKYAPESGAKTIFLTGQLLTKHVDGPVPILTLGTAGDHVDCTFAGDDFKRLESLQAGEVVHLAGDLVKQGDKTAELENCYIILTP